jgi:hypothetical protein
MNKLEAGAIWPTVPVTLVDVHLIVVKKGQSHKSTPPAASPKLLPITVTIIPGPISQGVVLVLTV